MKKRLLLSTALALLAAALPSHAGISLDRTSPSIAVCGFPVNPARLFSLVPPAGGCDIGGAGPVAEVLPPALGLVGNDNIDGLSANTLTPPDLLYHLVFSADRDALVVWDRGVLGVVDPGVDYALFSLARVPRPLARSASRRP